MTGYCTMTDGSVLTMDSQHACESSETPGKWETAPSEITEQCQEYIDACLTMSCMCGFGYLCMWGLRLGFVVRSQAIKTIYDRAFVC